MSENININKPGEGALKALANLNKLEVEFKRPLSTDVKKTAKRKKIKVLDEDTYIEELGKIIQRDFFPDLEKLKAQNDYLEAIERNDVVKMRELYAKYSSGKPISARVASPATFETPITKPNETPNPLNSEIENIHSEDISDSDNTKPKQSLDEYLSTHTSEDNMSFQEIMDAAEKKLRQKFNVLYGVEDKNPELISKMLTLPSFEEQIALRDKPKELDSWTYTNKNYIMYVPDSVELTKDEKIEMAKLKQEISHCNTRLNCNPFDEQQSKETISEIAKMQKRTLDGRIGVDGNTLTTSSRGEIRGYGFIATPSPNPSAMGESPLMTWGEIEGTPFRLDGSGTPLRSGTGPAFKIAETPRREKIALALAEKAGERHRGLKKKAMDAAKRQMASPSPRPASSLERLASMSPAARRLVTGKLVSGPSALNIATPSPSHKSLSNTPKYKTTPVLNNLKLKATPESKRAQKIVSSSGKFDVSLSTSNGLTDDLLKIPSIRKSASDFF